MIAIVGVFVAKFDARAKQPVIRTLGNIELFAGFLLFVAAFLAVAPLPVVCARIAGMIRATVIETSIGAVTEDIVFA